MASFNWRQNVDAGCPFCGTSINERGFIDCIADTVLRDPQRGEITGVVDITICATCAEQISRLVGSATKSETEELTQMVIDRDEELEKTKDEVEAWTQRFNNLIDALSEGINVNSIDTTAGRVMPLSGDSPTKSEPGEKSGSKKSRSGKKQLANSTK